MADYTVTTLSYVVRPMKSPIFSEAATVISIEDEAAGEFVVIDQSSTGEYGRIAINDRSEWIAICTAVEKLLKEVREND